MLGYSIFDKSKVALLSHIINSSKKLHIISGNPEVLYIGLSNKELFNNFTGENSIIIPDGAGVVLAAKLLKTPVAEKIAGIDLMEALLTYCSENKKPIYLLGATQEILKKCMENMLITYPQLIIAGSHNGYFDLNNCSEILEDINKKEPYVLFSAMGCPRQELFNIRNMSQLHCSIFMGVGGCFDVFAGKIKRAPGWMLSMNLEWLYRVSKEPYRIKRLGSIPKFLIKVLREDKKKDKHSSL